GGAPALRRGHVHAGAPGLAEADGDRLLGVAGAVLAAADLVDLLADELAGLDGRALARALVGAGTLEGALSWHADIPGRGDEAGVNPGSPRNQRDRGAPPEE